MELLSKACMYLCFAKIPVSCSQVATQAHVIAPLLLFLCELLARSCAVEQTLTELFQLFLLLGAQCVMKVPRLLFLFLGRIHDTKERELVDES